MEAEAMIVLNRLVSEDDQSIEAWYLGGWCQHLMAEREKASNYQNGSGDKTQTDQAQDVDATLKSSRHWLKTSMKLYELLDYEDERLFEHAKELVTSLDMVLGPEDEQAEEGAEDDEDEWEGIEDDEEEIDEEMKDA